MLNKKVKELPLGGSFFGIFLNLLFLKIMLK